MQEIIYCKNFHEKLEKFKKVSKENLFVIADFDGTISKIFSEDGEYISGMEAILRNYEILGKKQSEKGQELFAKYFPIEFGEEYSLDERIYFMEKWWSENFKFYEKYGLNTEHLNQVLENYKSKIRNGIKTFFETISEFQIPVIVFSASGLGKYPIQKFLEKSLVNLENFSFICNQLNFDENGFMKGLNGKIIHTLCKSEIDAEKDFPEIYEKIGKRKNAILFGDSFGDPFMLQKMDFENILKVGFLNPHPGKNIEDSLKTYQNLYDLIFTGDHEAEEIGEIFNFIK